MVKFVFLQSNSNLFRYEEVQRVSGLLLIASIFESISSLFFTTGPLVGKIGHMHKSVAFGQRDKHSRGLLWTNQENTD